MLSFCGFSAFAQLPTEYQGYGLRMQFVDGTAITRIPSDTTTNKTGIARIGSTLYVGNGTKWTAAAGGGSSTDTTSLSNRINQKVNISDTAGMLSKYLRKVDTTCKWITYVGKNATANRRNRKDGPALVGNADRRV